MRCCTPPAKASLASKGMGPGEVRGPGRSPHHDEVAPVRLRDWPPRRIGKMWLIGVAGQLAALFIVPLLLGWELSAPWNDPLDTAPPAALDTAALADLDTSAHPLTITRTPTAAGDTLVRIARDSSYLALRTSGGTVEMSPDVEKGAAALGDAFVSMFDALATLFTVLAVILLVPPLVLGSITLAWALQRRRPASVYDRGD